jgi:mono/diheme cytochrome c family protein
MKIFGKLVIAGAVLFGVLQLVRPGIPAKPAAAEVQAPPEVRQILEKSCYSCHSDQRRLAWFDQVVPGYWLVRHDILTAREHMDFSTLGSKLPAAQRAALYESVNMIQLGAMPLPSFLRLHPEAKVTPEELAALKAYLSPWAPAAKQPGSVSAWGPPNTGAAPGSTPPVVSLASVQPEFDGFSFDPTFEGWKPISFTDRGDNNTFRFVLGNDIAVKAARSGNISPWPDGARFAKIAWQREEGPDGLAYPGKFVQVELMLKDAKQYKKTDGWGWGRWRGLDLKPYGQGARFVNECTGCHMPVRGNDFVYTLPISPASIGGAEVVNNRAALPENLPYQPLGWNAITMYADAKTHAMATLFGNDAAMQAVHARFAGGADARGPSFPSGAVLALVTWAQRDDPHWFGARIPDAPQSVEFVKIAGQGEMNSYRRFAGSGLSEDRANAGATAQRMDFILNLAPARLP